MRGKQRRAPSKERTRGPSSLTRDELTESPSPLPPRMEDERASRPDGEWYGFQNLGQNEIFFGVRTPGPGLHLATSLSSGPSGGKRTLSCQSPREIDRAVAPLCRQGARAPIGVGGSSRPLACFVPALWSECFKDGPAGYGVLKPPIGGLQVTDAGDGGSKVSPRVRVAGPVPLIKNRAGGLGTRGWGCLPARRGGTCGPSRLDGAPLAATTHLSPPSPLENPS